jgi:hypothetical protein
MLRPSDRQVLLNRVRFAEERAPGWHSTLSPSGGMPRGDGREHATWQREVLCSPCREVEGQRWGLGGERSPQVINLWGP